MAGLARKAARLFSGEEGSLSELVWVIGAAVVVVLIVVVFMALAPDTARSVWSTFTGYMLRSFGL